MKCECLLSDSLVIESRKDPLENATFRCRECKLCGSMRVTVEVDYLDLRTCDHLKYMMIPWHAFKLAKVKRAQEDYEKLEDSLAH